MAGIEASLMMGATIGISIAAPFGPTSMLCVQRTLSFGLCAGLATGLGIATVHLVYGTLASLSAAHILIASQHSPIFPVAASLLLLAFALRVVRSDIMAEAATGSSKDLGSVYWGAIGFGFLNPVHATAVCRGFAKPRVARYHVGSVADHRDIFRFDGVVDAVAGRSVAFSLQAYAALPHARQQGKRNPAWSHGGNDPCARMSVFNLGRFYRRARDFFRTLAFEASGNGERTKTGCG